MAASATAEATKLAYKVTHHQVGNANNEGDLTAHVTGLWKRCPRCQGSGVDWSLWQDRREVHACERCDGKGIVENQRPVRRVARRVRWED